MGKKLNQKKLNNKLYTYTEKLKQLSKITMIQGQKQYKQFLWKCHKEGRISMKSESVLNKYIDKLQGKQDLQDQFEEQFQLSEKLYAKTKQIFKKGSLNQKYSNLLKGILQQTKIQQKQQLSESQLQQLSIIQTIYTKYKVSSMFRQNLVKQIKTKHLDKLIIKGYLNSRKISKQNIKDSFFQLNFITQESKPLQVIQLVF